MSAGTLVHTPKVRVSSTHTRPQQASPPFQKQDRNSSQVKKTRLPLARLNESEQYFFLMHDKNGYNHKQCLNYIKLFVSECVCVRACALHHRHARAYGVGTPCTVERSAFLRDFRSTQSSLTKTACLPITAKSLLQCRWCQHISNQFCGRSSSAITLPDLADTKPNHYY